MMIEDKDLLIIQIANCLVGHDGMTARELARSLGIPKRTINRVLYASRFRFDHSEDVPPIWYCTQSEKSEWQIDVIE
jgi:hypothetical protein